MIFYFQLLKNMFYVNACKKLFFRFIILRIKMKKFLNFAIILGICIGEIKNLVNISF